MWAWLIRAIVAGVADAIRKELDAMSATLEQQIQQATATIQADIAAVANDITNLGTIAEQIKTELANLGTIVPGSTVTQADVTALLAAGTAADALKTATDAAVANLQSIANPGTATPAPPPTP